MKKLIEEKTKKYDDFFSALLEITAHTENKIGIKCNCGYKFKKLKNKRNFPFIGKMYYYVTLTPTIKSYEFIIDTFLKTEDYEKAQLVKEEMEKFKENA